MPRGELDFSNPELEESWQAVSRDDNDVDWALFKLTGDLTKLELVGYLRRNSRSFSVSSGNSCACH
jgi:hypothetical protein